MRARHLIPTLVLAAVVVTGCGAATPGTGTATTAATSGTGTATAATLAATHDDDADLTWDEAAEVAVTLADGATTGGSGVTVDGNTVTITAPATYRVSGSLTDGTLVVDSADDGIVRLVLDDAAVASSTGPAILVTNADEVVLILADGYPLVGEAAYGLRPSLVNRYARTTLLLAGGVGRLTIDRDLEAATTDGLGVALLDTLIVETKSTGPAGAADRALWALGVRPARISKFCTALAAIRPDFPANRWTRALRRPWVRGSSGLNIPARGALSIAVPG